MRPLSSTVEDLGVKTVLLAAKCVVTLKHTLGNIEQEVRPQPTRTPVDTVWNTIWSRSGFFLCSNHFVKLTLVSVPLVILRGFLHKLENGLMGRVPFALGAWREDLTPKVHNLIPDSSSSSSGFLPSSEIACKQSIGVLETMLVG